LECGKWRHYFDALGLSVDPKDVDQLLRFAVFNSMVMGYHRPDRRMVINPVTPPKMFQKVYKKKMLQKVPVAPPKNIQKAAVKSEKKATKRRVSVNCKVALNKLLGDAAKERPVLSEKEQKKERYRLLRAKRAEERYRLLRVRIDRYSIRRPSPPQSTEHTVSSTDNVPKRPKVQQTTPSQSASVVVPTASTVDRAAVSQTTVSAANNVPKRTTVSTLPRTVSNVVNAVPNKQAVTRTSVAPKLAVSRRSTKVKATKQRVTVKRHEMCSIHIVPVLRSAGRNVDDLSTIKRRLGVRPSVNVSDRVPVLNRHSEIVQTVPFQSGSGAVHFRRTIRLVDGHSTQFVAPQTGGSTWTLRGNGYGVCSGGIWSDDRFFEYDRVSVPVPDESVRTVNVSESSFSAETPNEDVLSQDTEQKVQKRRRRRKRR
jgi:hypothetical protein